MRRPGPVRAFLLDVEGVLVREDRLVGALDLGARWLRERGRRQLLWLGHPRLRPWWRDQGFDLVAAGACDTVVLGLNPELGPAEPDAALEAPAGPGRTVTVGKPAEPIYHEALKRVAAAPAETLFISDDPVADLVTAGRLGLRTAFVLSGKHADCEVLGSLDQDDWPDLVCANLADIDPDGAGNPQSS